MRSKLIHEENGLRTFALAFEPGEEVLQGITRFAAAEGLNAAEVTGLGAFSSATLGYFDLEKKDYEEIPVEEQVEALTLVGNIAAFRGNRDPTSTPCSAGAAAPPSAATCWRPGYAPCWRW